jgi:phage FluMu gp28-like protein
MEQVGDVLWTREVVTLKRTSFAEHDRVMDGLFERYRVRRLAMDQTGMGEKPVEDAKRRYGESRVEGVLFTSGSKQTLATLGKQGFEDRLIRIPMGDRAIRADLHKLQKVVGPTGNVRFVAEADSTGHADRAWACFLAQSAAANPGARIEFQGIGRPRMTYRGF